MTSERVSSTVTAPANRAAPLIAIAAYAMVFFVFLGDWFSPTLVVVGIAYEAPIVFAALRGTRKLTIQVVALAVVGLVLGWFMDAQQASFIWSDQRIENRLLSAVSILIVATLALLLQQSQERAERNAQPGAPVAL